MERGESLNFFIGQVVVSEAKNLRECAVRRQPDVMANLRIIEKNSPKYEPFARFLVFLCCLLSIESDCIKSDPLYFFQIACDKFFSLDF